MQIHSILSRDTKDRKRIGRGGKRGTYCGRGVKGQKSRSGAKIDPLFEGGRSSLVERLKKNRGFKSIHTKKNIVSLADLERGFQENGKVSIRALVQCGLLDKARVEFGVRILGTGILRKKLTLDGNIYLTKSAREAVEKAGGTILERKKEEK